MDEYVKFASSLPPTGQLPTLTFIALILGLGKGGVPGLATIATAATVLTAPSTIPSGLGYAVALMVPILTMIDIYAAYLHRMELDWPTVWLLLPTSFVGMVIGQLLDKHISDKGARLLVGFILLGILALRIWKDIATFLFPRWAIQCQLSGDSKEHKVNIEGKGSLDDEEAEELLKQIHTSNGDDYKNKHQEISKTSSHLDIDDGNTGGSSSKIKKRKQLSPTTRFIWACIVGLIGGAATMLTNSMVCMYV